MQLIEVDGQDVEAVYAATLAAREHALSGQGADAAPPAHVPAHRPLRRRPAGLPREGGREQERETQDPIELLGARLGIGDEEFEAIDAEVTAEVEASVEFAKAGTDPTPEDALK